MEQGPIDHRRFPRARYPCAITIWRDEEVEQVVLAATTDIAAASAAVYLNHAITIGAAVDLEIQISSEDSFRCRGEILRCTQDTSSVAKDYYKIVIEFKDLDEFQTYRLQRLIEKIRKQSG